MSVAEYREKLASAKLGKNDLNWFPKWLDRYRQFLGATYDSRLRVSYEDAVRFSKRLHRNGVEAWQRLQAVRAIDGQRSGHPRTSCNFLGFGGDTVSLLEFATTLTTDQPMAGKAVVAPIVPIGISSTN